jgi:hypothetical protein
MPHKRSTCDISGVDINRFCGAEMLLVFSERESNFTFNCLTYSAKENQFQ